ncbi:MAG: AEC family transporter [Spirochaetota bacterium]
MEYLEVLSKVVPVIVLLSLGYVLKIKQFISSPTVGEMKKLVVNVSLPALLFLAFLDVHFKAKYLVVIVVVFLVNILMLLLGGRFKRLFRVNDPYFTLMFTGFEVGMLGIPMFGAVFGVENIKYMGILDIGQELYVWFVLLGIIFSISAGSRDLKKLAASFISSPIIIAIFLGIALNTSGIQAVLKDNKLYVSVINTVELVSQLTIPLILLIIGYEINLDFHRLRLPVKIIGLRLVVLLPLALFIGKALFLNRLNLPGIYYMALLSMFILPPPFVIPLFARDERHDHSYIYNTLSVGTVVFVLLYVILIMYFAAGEIK